MISALSVYLSGEAVWRETFRKYARQLGKAGISCVSEWVFEEEDSAPDRLHLFALANLQNIRDADVFVLFTEGLSSSGEQNVEFGYALAQGLVPIVVGPQYGMFQNLPEVVQFNSWDKEVMKLLTSLEPTGEGAFH